LFGSGGPAFRLPAGRGDADGEDAEHHEDEIERAHGNEGHGDDRVAVGLEVGHEVCGERAADHGAAAEAHDGQTGG
jgi:hypothetical protein